MINQEFLLEVFEILAQERTLSAKDFQKIIPEKNKRFSPEERTFSDEQFVGFCLGKLFVLGCVSYETLGDEKVYKIAITDNQMSAFKDQVSNNLSKVVCERALGVNGKKRCLDSWRQVAGHMRFMGSHPSMWEEQRKKQCSGEPLKTSPTLKPCSPSE